jgi:hypothetical protein
MPGKVLKTKKNKKAEQKKYYVFDSTLLPKGGQIKFSFCNLTVGT